MEIVNKTEKAERDFKILCVVSIGYGVFMIIKAFGFVTSTVQVLQNGALSMVGIGTFFLVLTLLVPVMLILAGIFGLLKKLRAVIVFSVIASIISLFSLITNLITLSTVTDWQHIVGNAIPMAAAAAIPVVLLIYALIRKNSKA